MWIILDGIHNEAKVLWVFIDDYSRKCWICFMQKKDQTFTRFFEFKALVDKDLWKKIKALRSDNGGEYVSQELRTSMQWKELNKS